MTDLAQIPKVDAHHHLWNLEENPYPWLTSPVEWRTFGDYSPIQKSYLISDYLADAQTHNVVASIHIEATWDRHADPVAETRWVQSVADDHGMIKGIVAYADLTAEDLETTLAAHVESPAVRGIRDTVGFTDDPLGNKRADRLDHARWANGFALLARYGLSFDLQAYPRQLERVAEIAARHDDVPLVIVHTGFPWDRSREGVADWRRAMKRLAELEHCFAKLSGPQMMTLDWSVDSFREFIDGAIELFGPQRCMFASNVPPDAVRQSYDDIYQAFYQWASSYSESECRAMFHDTAARLYRLEI